MTCAHCEELEGRIAWLESELGLQRDGVVIQRFRMAFGLTTAEAEILHALHSAKGRVLSSFNLLEATISPSGNRDRAASVAAVLIVRIRKKIGHDAVTTVWGRGYHLSSAGMALVAAALQPAGEIAA